MQHLLQPPLITVDNIWYSHMKKDDNLEGIKFN